MRRHRTAEFQQVYHAQSSVDAEGSRLIVGQAVAQSATAKRQLVAGLQPNPTELGQADAVLSDNG